MTYCLLPLPETNPASYLTASRQPCQHRIMPSQAHDSLLKTLLRTTRRRLASLPALRIHPLHGDLVHLAQERCFACVKVCADGEEIEKEGKGAGPVARGLQNYSVVILKNGQYAESRPEAKERVGLVCELELARQKEVLRFFDGDAEVLRGMVGEVGRMSLRGERTLEREQCDCVQTFVGQDRALEAVVPLMLKP